MTAIRACRSCGSAELVPFLDLGAQPLANALLTASELGAAEPTYPIVVVLCRACTLVQITETVPPEVLFREYLYFSSFSDTMLRHARESAERLIRERSLSRDSLVVEIASNDGYMLKNFVEAGIPVLGIEPARNIAIVARKGGIETIDEFFSAALASGLVASGRRADLMLANNVMAHVPDINDIVSGISELLAPEGAFVMETPYVRDMIENVEFDTMYHEHVFCHSLTALEHLFQRHGLAAADVEWIGIHGGTIRVAAVHAGLEGDRPRVREMLQREAEWGVGDPATYQDFGERVARLRSELRALLERLRSEGKRVAGYGAAAKGSTLLNYMGIGREHLDYVVDRSTYKQGRYLPGNHLPVHPPERLLEDRPDHVLLLAWNLADEVMSQQAAYRTAGGKFIIPVPSVRVV